jgi:hypothetical protein
MSSSALNENVIPIDGTVQDNSHGLHQGNSEKVEEFVLRARAVFAVTLLGAGCWYGLWKIALHFLPAQ